MNPPLCLTEAQRDAVAESDGAPVRLIDARTDRAYVLLAADDYQRLRPMLERDPFHVRESYPLQERAARLAGWDDPRLDAYGTVQRSTPRR